MGFPLNSPGKLETTIMEAEGNRQEQEKEYEEVISQRDILGTQLIRRNDELALLYEKVKIQQNTLQKGEVAYKERVEEIRNLKINVPPGGVEISRILKLRGRTKDSLGIKFGSTTSGFR